MVSARMIDVMGHALTLHAPAEAIVIGASAGAIEALRILLSPLPATFPCPVIVVVHVPQHGPSMIVELFTAWCALAVHEPDDKQPIGPGIWFAPPGYHLLVELDRTFSLSMDEPVGFSRPSIDVLFETAAEAYAASLLAVVLTGASDDGARGALAVRDAAGVVVVQSPEEAASPMMPRAAIALARPQIIAPLEVISEVMREAARVGYE